MDRLMRCLADKKVTLPPERKLERQVLRFVLLGRFYNRYLWACHLSGALSLCGHASAVLMQQSGKVLAAI